MVTVRSALFALAAISFAGCNCGTPLICAGEACLPDGGFPPDGSVASCGGLNCTGVTPVCLSEGGNNSCVQCVSDDQCVAPTTRCGANHVCTYVPNNSTTMVGTATGGSGENCDSPFVLTFSDGRVFLEGNNETAVNDNRAADGGEAAFPACGVFSHRRYGPDVVYQYTLDKAQDVLIKATPISGNLNPTIYVTKGEGCRGYRESDFVADPNTNKTACDQPLRFTQAKLTLFNQPAGTYYLWVDSNDDNSMRTRGHFYLEMNLLPASVPVTNDTCETATEIHTFPAAFSANQLSATDQQSPACGPSTGTDGADVVYRFVTTEPKKLTVDVTPSELTPKYQPVIFLRSSLASCNVTTLALANDFACTEAQQWGATANLEVSNLPAGEYYLVIDGDSSAPMVTATRGVFTVNVDLKPVATAAQMNQSCSSPTELTFNPNGVATVRGTTFLANDNTTVAAGDDVCVPTPTPDVVYKFNTGVVSQAGGPNVNAKIMLRTLNRGEYLPRFSMRATCGSTALTDQLLCYPWSNVAFNEARAMYTDIPAATDVYVWVDGASAMDRLSGPFNLEVQLAAQGPANDVCAGAIAVAANSSIEGTNLGADDNYRDYTGPNCEVQLRGADVVYSFTPSTSGIVNLTATPDQTLNIGLAVLTSCAPNTCIGSADTSNSDYGRAERTSFAATAGQTYYIVVESAAPLTATEPPYGYGRFKLDVEMK